MKRLSLMMIAMCMCVATTMATPVEDGTAENPYLISTAADLQGLSATVMGGEKYAGKHFKMTNDIDLAGVLDFIPIGGWSNATANDTTKYFSGVFDGAEHKVQNLVIDKSADNLSYVALFGMAKAYNQAGVTIKNLGVTGTSSFTGTDYVGGLIAYVSSSYSNSSSIVISNCYATGSVSAMGANGGTGGLIAYVSSSNSNSSLVIENCYATGIVTGNSSAGGLIAVVSSYSYSNSSSSIEISNCYAPSAVIGNNYTGGLIAKVSSTGARSSIGISNCYSTGDLSALGDTGLAGGLFAELSGSNITLSHCYTISKILISSSSGGVVAKVTASTFGANIYLSNCFFLVDTDINASLTAIASGEVSVTPSAVEPKTRAELKDNAILFLLNTDQNPQPWALGEGLNNGYPLLSSIKATITVKATASALSYGDKLSTSQLTSGKISIDGVEKDVVFTFETPDTLFSAGDHETFVLSTGITPQIRQSISVKVNKKGLTLSGVVASDKLYDGTTTASLKGEILLDTLSGALIGLAMPTARFVDKHVSENKEVTVVAGSLTGADAGNYTLVLPTDLTASIIAKPIIVSGIIANSKVYDGTTTATLNYAEMSFAGMVGDDVLGVSATATFADKNVGVGKIVTLSEVSLMGVGAVNYILVIPTGLTADITENITANKYTVSFVANGGTGDEMLAQEFVYGIAEPLSVNTYEKAGHSFVGWATTATGDVITGNYSATANITLFAIWEPMSALEVVDARYEVTRMVISPNPVSRTSGEVTIYFPQNIVGTGTCTIYDAQGNRIDYQDINLVTGKAIKWDLCNQQGRRVATGGYLAILQVTDNMGMVHFAKSMIGVSQ